MVEKVFADSVPHPLARYRSTTQLNPDAYEEIRGAGEYELYYWREDGSDFSAEVDAGPAEYFDSDIAELYENSDSITVVFPAENRGYVYPKEFFELLPIEEDAA